MLAIKYRIKNEAGEVLRTNREWFNDLDQATLHAKHFENKNIFVNIYRAAVKTDIKKDVVAVLDEEIAY